MLLLKALTRARRTLGGHKPWERITANIESQIVSMENQGMAMEMEMMVKVIEMEMEMHLRFHESKDFALTHTQHTMKLQQFWLHIGIGKLGFVQHPNGLHIANCRGKMRLRGT